HVRVVLEDGRAHRLTAVAPYEAGQHEGVTVHDARAFRSRRPGQELIAGDEDRDLRTADDGEGTRAGPDGSEDAEVLRPQSTAGSQDDRTRGDVLADTADVLARGDRLGNADLTGALLGGLGLQDGVGPGGDGGARHDADGLTRLDGAPEGAAREGFADDGQF